MPGFELFGNEERTEVNNVLETGVLMRYGFDSQRQGQWKSLELEGELERFLNVKHAHLTSSGTAALTVAMSVLGIGAGDEVIMPSFTFVASFEAIISVGAIPVIAEIDTSLSIDPDLLGELITDKTKAVMAVHMCGGMGNVQGVKSFCDEHELYLIEDACQSFGGSFKSDALGTIGDIGCFSFDYVKTITCGEGGAIVTNNDLFAERARQYSDHGHDHIGNDRGLEQHSAIGYNFRISEMNSAVGLAQIRKIDIILKIQKRNKQILKDSLAQIDSLEFRQLFYQEGDNASFLSFFLESNEIVLLVVEAFAENGIDATWNYLNNNWHYVNNWDHLKEGKSNSPLSNEQIEGLQAIKSKKFNQSDDLIGRNISCLVKLSWTENEVKERGRKMKELIEGVISKSH